MDAIAAYDLTKIYGGNPALKNINLQVPEGGAMGCVGLEGAGKTTLVRLMAGLGRPTSGECSVLGLSPGFESARLHGMTGTVLQSARLYASMSLWENLKFFAGVNYVPKNQAVERISFLMHRLNIWDERDRTPAQLSTGVLTRAGLARALLHRPRVVLMDEQGEGMDRESAEMVRDLLGYALREEGITLLLCTQHMNYAESICGSFGLLHKGILLARGTMESLRVGGGVQLKAALRLAEGGKGLPGFRLEDEFWQREIASEREMPEIIAQAVEQGASLYEARVLRPTLEEIYDAYLAGGRRRGEFLHGETGVRPQSGPYSKES